ncbi:uncharacterized protein [Prorops nasuta]|uniref:uncharacterized protein n=1 Tax=Prorops nasuta TaxID=863751 RepID=UPI0034CE5F8C
MVECSKMLTSYEREIREKYYSLMENTSSSIEDYINFIKKCNKAIKSIKSYMNMEIGVGRKISAEAKLNRIIGLMRIIERKKKSCLMTKNDKIGGGGGGEKKINKTNERKYIWQEVQSNFKNRLQTGVIINVSHIEPINFMLDVKDSVLQFIQKAIFKFKFIKEVKYFNTNYKILCESENIINWYEIEMSNIKTQLEEFQERDSGWALSKIINIVIQIIKYHPMTASSYIKLPQWIQNKHAVINVKNRGKDCFAWAIMTGLFPAKKNCNLLSSYPHYKNYLNFEGLEFPISIKDIPKFEKLNKISINVFVTEKKKILPTHLTKEEQIKHFNLLYISNDYNYHYCLIKNLSYLLSNQCSRDKHTKYFCNRCMHYFSSNDKLIQHRVDCNLVNDCAVVLPAKNNNILQFKNYYKKLQVPFVIYADFECLLEKIDSLSVPAKAFQQHKPYSIGYYVSCIYNNNLSRFKMQRSIDCAKWFTNELQKIAVEISEIINDIKPMEMSKQDIQKFVKASFCYICEKPFSVNDVKVRDHDHITGLFRGAAHNSCNINYKLKLNIPVIFHNLSNYDAHFLIRDITNSFEGDVKVIPLNMEKYMTIIKFIKNSNIQFIFLDLFRFLNSSLEKLDNYVDQNNFTCLKSEFQDISLNAFNLLTRKGVFPYDYVKDLNVLNESKLPSRELFYNYLNECKISENDYTHALKVWNTFNIQNIGEYSDLYLKTDVLLLADIFENFRKSCINNYRLDPVHYFSLPSYTWDVMLFYTDIKLELVTDIDMLTFIERGIRGGLSQCSNRYAKANNKFLSNYNSSESSRYLMYFDVNNLYGWAMSQALPFGQFEWVENCENFNVNDYADDSDTGYIIEVDLFYPEKIHDLQRDLPMCPENKKPPKSKISKLLATLNNKYRYVMHYRNLKQALNHGVVLEKIHRILKFKQSFWLKSYIDLNTKLRTESNSDFEKNLYKLMNNAVFGKTIENVRKRYLVAIQMKKLNIIIDKPIFIGMCVLDLSKVCLYSFHYDVILPKLKLDVKLLYTDTDSLIYEFKCENIYDFIREKIDYFDTSDFPINNIYNIPLVNKKVIGLMKDECNGNLMSEFVGLRSKMYAYRINGVNKDKKCIKGIKSYVVKNIEFDDYIDSLKNFNTLICKQNIIRSNLHNVFTICEEKIALSPYDDNRYLIANSTDTLPWGHKNVIQVNYEN